MIKLIAWDPGHRIGVAMYNELWKLIGMDVISFDKLVQHLLDYEKNFIPDPKEVIFIIEEFRVYPGKAKKLVMSDLKTVQAIGKIEGFAIERGIRVVKHKAQFKNTGFEYLGQKEPSRSNPMSHALVANAHAVYWLANNGHLNLKELLNG